jgi:hypothetical protein
LALSPLLLLASASSVQPAYPAESLLRELESVCLTDGRYDGEKHVIGPVSGAINQWIEIARRQGWELFTDTSANLLPMDREAYRNLVALNYTIAGSFVPRSYELGREEWMLGGQVFRKVVAGRRVYLSLLGTDFNGGDAFAECRIHDPLGDGFRKNPVSAHAIQTLAQSKLRKTKGPFGSTRYSWPAQFGRIGRVDVHFGFGGWLLGPEGQVNNRRFDPYAPYGLTLVAGYFEQSIVV